LVDGGNDGSGEDRFIDEPEAVQEMVDPIGGFVLGGQAHFDELALDVVSGVSSCTGDGGGIVGVAKGEEDEEPAPAKAETGDEMGSEDSLRKMS